MIQDENTRIIRELREEIDKLREMVSSGDTNKVDGSAMENLAERINVRVTLPACAFRVVVSAVMSSFRTSSTPSSKRGPRRSASQRCTQGSRACSTTTMDRSRVWLQSFEEERQKNLADCGIVQWVMDEIREQNKALKDGWVACCRYGRRG